MKIILILRTKCFKIFDSLEISYDHEEHVKSCTPTSYAFPSTSNVPASPAPSASGVVNDPDASNDNDAPTDADASNPADASTAVEPPKEADASPFGIVGTCIFVLRFPLPINEESTKKKMLKNQVAIDYGFELF